MLIRFLVNNYLSYASTEEFNTLPSNQKAFAHHKYIFKGIEFLKLGAIYGANGAGKSNLIKAFSVLRDIVVKGDVPSEVFNSRFKLSVEAQKKPISFTIEFINNEKAFIYGIEIDKGRIASEELYISGLGKKENKKIFSKKTNENNKNEFSLSGDIEELEDGKLLKKLIKDTYKSSEKSFLNLLNELEHPLLSDLRDAYNWFSSKLEIVNPFSTPQESTLKFKENPQFQKFTKKMMCSFHTGISDVDVESIRLDRFLGENESLDTKEITEKLENDPTSNVSLRNQKTGEEVIVTNEGGEILAHRMFFRHAGDQKGEKFYIDDESDGTKRLLDYIPAFEAILEKEVVFLIDEIERSIHPLIIKELLKKFSKQENTKGQIIFTTHETHLLDQEIFRRDEIWFTEKNNDGATHLYPLSKFKVHHTKNIERGYINGRFGAVPFLGNLDDLNWNKMTEKDAS
ncbi:MAG: ATP-binding protein [Candidatus Paceibacterota bacterium]